MQAAGDDGGEMSQIGGDVDGEAVHADPAADADAHGAKFGELARVCSGKATGGGISHDPDTGCGCVALRGHAERCACVHDALFEQSHVCVEA